MTRSKLLAALAVCVIAGGVLLWRATRSQSPEANVPAPRGESTAPAKPTEARAPTPVAREEAPTGEREPPAPPPEEEIEPASPPEPAPPPAIHENRPERERTGAVLKLSKDVTDEELNEVLKGYGLVVQRRFQNMVRVAPADGGGDVTALVDAIEDDGLLEVPDRE